MKYRYAGILAGSLWISLVPPAHAQVLGTGVTPTIEVPGPLLEAAVATAITSADTAVNSGVLVVDSATNLVPVEAVVVGEGLVTDLRAMGEILAEVEGLSNDVRSLEAQLNALFNLDMAPDTSRGLRERLQEVRQVRAKCYSTAMKLQTLMLTAFRTIDHVVELVNSLATLLGQQQNLQVLNQHVSSLTQQVTALQVVTSSFYRAQSVDKLEELLIGESRRRITAKVYQVE